MGHVLIVATTELKRRIRSRSALITAIVAPLALAVVFGNLIGGAASGGGTFDIGIVDAGGTEMSGEIAAAVLADDRGSEAVRFSSVAESDAEQLVEDAELGAAILVGGEGEMSVISSEERAISSQIAEAVAHSIAGSVQSGGQESIPLGSLPLGGRELSVMAYFGASMSGLLLFFTMGAGPRSMMEDRDNHTLSRMLSGPVAPGAILAGKVLAAAALGAFGFVVVWLVTTVMFEAEWGDPLGVFVVLILTVFAIGGISLFVGGLARTPQQAETYTTVVGFLLALLGGAFVPPVDTPAALRALSRFTPNGLSLNAFSALNADEASLADLAPELLALIAIGVVFGAFGVQTSRS